MSQHPRSRIRASASSSRGRRLQNTNQISISGLTRVTQTPGAALMAIGISPTSALTTNLGYWSGRLASEADLWQEFRFTKLSFHWTHVAAENTANSSNYDGRFNAANSLPYVAGYCQPNPNSAVGTYSEVLEMPVSHQAFVPLLGTVGAAYPQAPRNNSSMHVPAHVLRPPFTPWLKVQTSTAGLDAYQQGTFYGLWNYNATTNTGVEILVSWTIEFRSPVPAAETIVLRKNTFLGSKVMRLVEDEKKDDYDHVSNPSLPQPPPGQRWVLAA